jgi:3-hydroxyisobutyrate dehydrogenase-like beta-hydroxyacid dehydrogenase
MMASEAKQVVGFIGLGAMGSEMAGNLIGAGFAVRVFNRTAARAESFAARGATVCRSVADAVKGAQFVVSIVADDEATRQVMLGEAGVVANAAAGTVVIDSSTNTPTMARAVAHAAQARSIQYLDSPVVGSIMQARNRELVFFVGGDRQAYERAQPLYAAMGRMNRRVGDSGAGATLKLVNNFLSGTASAALAEAMQVAEAAGLDSKLVIELLNEGASASRLTKTKLPKMATREFSPQFQLALMEKDLRYYLALAQEFDRPVPLGSLVRSQLQAARRAGLGQLDVSAVFLQISGEAPKR